MHFLITVGGTREYIDPIRFISNASSGQMGYALASAAIKAGHKATLISAADLQPPIGVDFVGVDSVAEMFAAVKKFFAKCDCQIMAAAVSDYTPVKKSKTKIKKSKRNLVIRLKPTVDILDWAGKHKHERRAASDGPRLIVGFALEDKNLRLNAEKKLKEKNLDMIIANKPAAIGADKTSVWIKTSRYCPARASGSYGWLAVRNKNKSAIAGQIIRLVERLAWFQNKRREE